MPRNCYSIHSRKHSRRPLKPTSNSPLRFMMELLEERQLLSTAHFAAISDYGWDNANELAVSTMVKSWNPEFIVTAGDNDQLSDATKMDATVGKYYHEYIYNYTGTYGAGSTTQRFFPTMGNHDWDVSATYLSYFTLPGNERYYDFVQGPIHFFVLDGDSREPDGNTSTSVQAQWLQGKLATATEPWQIVLFHQPAYSSSTKHGSSTAMQWPFASWGVDAAISGHNHVYERLFVGGMSYFVDGLGGAAAPDAFGTPIAGDQFCYNSDLGAMLIDADDTSMTFKFYAKSGTLIDSYTISHNLTAPTNPVATSLSNSSIKLTWENGSTSENGYTIERSVDNVTFTQVGTVAANVLTYTDSNLSANTKYYYRVRAYRGTTEFSGYSGVANATTAAYATVGIIATGSTWKYLDNGSNQGTAWQAITFADSTWKSGAAQLGYGDGDEKTILSYGPDANNKYVTDYFRKTFTITNKDAFTALTLRLLRDDGAVVYLNGTEVARSNMPTGTIAYNTYASTAIGGTDESTYYSFSISPSLLVNGTNVLAIEVHQANATSTDVSFDAALSGTTLVLPVAWADKNIGSVGLAGTASAASGIFTASGSGADIWGTADAFNYVYQPWTGNGTIIARVDSVQNTNGWAKAGVMFRESLAANAKFVDVLVTPSSGVSFQRRSATGGSSASTTVSGLKAPYWVKLVRNGSTFSAYRSANGSTWTLIGTASVSMASTIYVGLAVTSHDNTKLCTAKFSNVSVSTSIATAVAAAMPSATLATTATLLTTNSQATKTSNDELLSGV